MRVLSFSFSFGFVNQVFLLNSHDKGDIVEKVVDVREKAVSEVQATTSMVSSGRATRKGEACLQAIGGK